MRHSAPLPVDLGGPRTDSDHERRRTVVLLAGVLLALLVLAWQATAANAGESRVTVAKVNAGGNAADQFGFVPSLALDDGNATPVTDPFTLAGGQQKTFTSIICNGTWSGCGQRDLTVTEQPTTGYALKSVECRSTINPWNGSGHDPWIEPGPNDPIDDHTTVSGATVHIQAEAGEWIKCVFTNAPTKTPPPPPTTPPTTPPGTTTPPVSSSTPPATVVPAPKVTVKPSSSISGRARLRSPQGCLIGHKIAASVRGRAISKVVFSIDGRRAATVTKARNGRFGLSLDTRRLAAGTHRVTARVHFKRSAHTRTRTLRSHFLRCRAARAQFTG
jgi:hypothetical protein